MPGIQDIKQVELYNKFWMLIPEENHKDWFYFATPPPMETCEKVKANQKTQKTLEHRVTVEQSLGEV